MIYPGLIDAAMILFLSLSVSSCQPPGPDEELPPEREIIAWVCHHPGSVWHLSECNDQCTGRNYDGEAYCLALREPMCQIPRDLQSDFIRRACGFYYRE